MSASSQNSQGSGSNIVTNNADENIMIEIESNIPRDTITFSDYDENSFNNVSILSDMNTSSASEGAGIITKAQQLILLKFIESDVAQLQLDLETKIMLHIQDVMKNPTSIDDNITIIRDIVNVGEDTYIYLKGFAKSLNSTSALKEGITSTILNLRNDLDKYNSAVVNLKQQLLDYISKEGTTVPEEIGTQQGGQPTGGVEETVPEVVAAPEVTEAVEDTGAVEVTGANEVTGAVEVSTLPGVSGAVDAVDAVDAVEAETVETVETVGGAAVGTTADTAVQHGGRKRSRKSTRTNKRRSRSRSRSRK